MQQVKTQISEGGRIVIPADYRRVLGLKIGDDVILVLEENEVRLVTPRQAVKRAQALVSRFVPKNRILTDELIRDRRQEVQRETANRSTARRRR